MVVVRVSLGLGLIVQQLCRPNICCPTSVAETFLNLSNGLPDRCIYCSTINDFKPKIKVALGPEM